MDWMKIVVNIVGAVAASLIAQHVLPEALSSAVTAVAAVLVGLVQEQPHKP